ncbi:hypothetical protein AURDEDRAFT_119234 [Auricularia subglabra TFB-10046 SS5]|nr:hypothetical protein AURDEDRAFT_119234 [Auricularia subglabra TFB-10046 SS5]
MPLPLPPELWDMIIDRVSSIDDRLVCALVCRAWHPQALRRIYQSTAVEATGRHTSEVDVNMPRLSAAAFRRLLDCDSDVLPMIQALRYDHLFNHQTSPELAGVRFPSTLRVASLRLRFLYLEEENDLLIPSNFARITSLDLNACTVESTAVFAAAMAEFPLLRNLSFSGSIFRPKFDPNVVVPPQFANPCDFAVDVWQPPTWSAVLQWCLLDLARIGQMTFDQSAGLGIICDLLPSNPDLGPHIHRITADYISGQEEKWVALDAALPQFTRLHTLRVQSFNRDPSRAPEQPALLDKLAAVVQRQSQVSRDLRVALLEIPEHLLSSATADAKDAVARLDAGLSRLRSLTRVSIRLSAHGTTRIWENDPVVIKSYTQKLPLLEQSGRLVLALPGRGHPE